MVDWIFRSILGEIVIRAMEMTKEISMRFIEVCLRI